MKGLAPVERIFVQKDNFPLLMTMLLMAGIGLSALFSASYFFGMNYLDNPYYLLVKQSASFIIGIVVMVIASKLPIEFIKKIIPIFLFFTVFLNILTYIPGIGYASGGARRWIEIFGQSFQPSELVRISLVLYLARMIEKNSKRLNDLKNSVLPPLLVVFSFVVLIYFQNDFSTAAYVLILSLSVLFVAGVDAVFIGGLLGSMALLFGIIIRITPWRWQRVLAWISPEKDPSRGGYQILRAKEALVQGGIFGKGFGHGEVKMGGIFSAHSDFIAAVIGEEAGLIGVIIVIILFFVFTVLGFGAAVRAKSEFNKFAIFGLTLGVFLQAIINLGVVCGLMPVTGIPLPLFSAGGSSVIITLLVFGLILALARPEEGKDWTKWN